jgi:hypothetical protein
MVQLMADGKIIQRNIAGVIMHDIALNIANVNLALVDMGLLKTLTWLLPQI